MIQNRHMDAKVTRTGRQQSFQTIDKLARGPSPWRGGCWVLPHSILDPSPVLPPPWSWLVDSNHHIGSRGRKLRKHQFWSFSQNGSWSFLSIYLPGALPSSWTLGSHVPVILIGFVIRGSKLLLLTNPNPRGRYQTKERLDWTGTRGIYPNQTLEPRDAPLLFHHDRNRSHSEQERKMEKAVNQRIKEN